MIVLAVSMWRTALGALVAAGSISTSLGCSPACNASDEANVPQRYEGGSVVNGIYTSSSAHEDLLEFPGGRRYDIFHGLGFEPLLVQMYWSFAEAGIGTDSQDEKSTLSLAAGNSALIQLKNAEYLRVKNDSCVHYWLLVVASGDPRVGDGGASAPDGGPADATDPVPIAERQ